MYLGKEIPVNIAPGPTGKPLSGGYLDCALDKGSNIVFTDSLRSVRNDHDNGD